MVNEHLENKLRTCVIELLAKGWPMEEVIAALQAIKVELAVAMQYHQAMMKK